MSTEDIYFLRNSKKCFCDIPMSELKKWAAKRYEDNIPTVELMKQAKNDHEREVIGVISLLDVEDDMLLDILSNVEKSDSHILACRLKTKKYLEKELSKR